MNQAEESQVPFEEMSTDEQILHVQDLWDRIAAHPEQVPVTDAQRAELRRRLDLHRSDRAAARPWSEIREEIERG